MAGHLLWTLYISRQDFPQRILVSQLKTHLRGKRKLKKWEDCLSGVDLMFVLWRGLCRNTCWLNSPVKCFLNCHPLREETAELGVSKIWEFKPVMSERTWVSLHVVCPQCTFIQVSFWSGPRPDCNGSEALGLNIRGCV